MHCDECLYLKIPLTEKVYCCVKFYNFICHIVRESQSNCYKIYFIRLSIVIEVSIGLVPIKLIKFIFYGYRQRVIVNYKSLFRKKKISTRFQCFTFNYSKELILSILDNIV